MGESAAERRDTPKSRNNPVELIILILTWLVATAGWAVIGFGAWMVLIIRSITAHAFGVFFSDFTRGRASSGRNQLLTSAGYYADGFKIIYQSIFERMEERDPDPLLDLPIGLRHIDRFLWAVFVALFTNLLFWIPLIMLVRALKE